MLPDLRGFQEAHERLIDVMGQDVTWLIEGEETWPEGTILDDDTGRPMDPRIEPETSADSQDIFKARVVTKPLSGDNVSESAIGLLRSGQIGAIIKVADRPRLDNAKGAIVMGREYAVKDIVEDGIDRITRYVVIMEPRG